MSGFAVLPAFWAAFGLALLSPGPNFAVILGTAATAGRPAATRVAVGMAAGEAVWGFAAVFGAAALAARHPLVAAVLRVGGGGFLLYLALTSLVAATRPAPAPRAAPSAARGERGGVGRGLTLMLLNPKAGAFWVSLTGVLLGPGAPAAVGVAAVLGAVLMSLLWHAALARALSAGAVARAYARVRRGLDALLGAVLGALGLRLVLGD